MSEFHPPRIVLHKASGLARVRIGSKDIYLGKYGSPEAAAAYARLVEQLSRGELPDRARPAGPLTVAQVVADWQLRVLPRYDPRGGERDAFPRAVEPLLKLFGSLPARDVDVVRLEAVREEMIGRGWCRHTINRRIVRIRTLWRWAEAQGHVPKGHWAHLRTLPALAPNDARVKHTEAVKPARWEDVLAVVRKCPPAAKYLLLLQWWSAGRSGELVSMRAEEIDRSGEVWLYRPSRHKNAWRGQERIIVLGRKCQSLLQRWLRACGAEGWLFVNRQNRPYTSSSYARAVLNAGRQAAVVLHPYSCRHAARLRIARLYGLEAARAILGHKSIQQTAGYASQLDLKTATEVARKMC